MMYDLTEGREKVQSVNRKKETNGSKWRLGAICGGPPQFQGSGTNSDLYNGASDALVAFAGSSSSLPRAGHQTPFSPESRRAHFHTNKILCSTRIERSETKGKQVNKQNDGGTCGGGVEARMKMSVSPLECRREAAAGRQALILGRITKTCCRYLQKLRFRSATEHK